jgi:uncharacterized membrane protein YdjX (TVP38/TMEM64 family)
MVNKNHIPLILFVVGIAAAIYYSGFNRYLTFQSLQDHRKTLLRWKAAAGFLSEETHDLDDELELDPNTTASQVVAILRQYPYLLAVSYVLIYTSLVSCSVPGATVLTLAAGILFDQPYSTLYAVAGAATGGCILFQLASSTPLARTLRRKIGYDSPETTTNEDSSYTSTSASTSNDQELRQRKATPKKASGAKNPLLDRLGRGFHSTPSSKFLNTLNNGLYLLMLRQVPIFPFWFVNIAPSVFGIPFWVFAITTYIGIIPGSFVYTELGRTLLDALDADHTGAIPDLNTFMKNAILSPRLVVPLVILTCWILFLILLRRILSSYRTAAAEADLKNGNGSASQKLTSTSSPSEVSPTTTTSTSDR